MKEIILDECKRQWKDNQEEIYGKWDEQTEKERKEYYEDIKSNLRND